MAEWLGTILIKGKTGQASNVGSDEAITILDLAYLVSSSFDSKPEVFIKGKPASEVDRYVPNIGKVKNELGALVRTALLYGIKKTITFNNEKIDIP